MLMLPRTAPLNPRTKEFCARIRSGARPQLMVIQPEPGSEPNNCFFSVRNRVRRDGGRIQLGWSIWELPGVYLEAERHAVFAPADGSPWLDISPALVPQITTRLFLPDDAAAEYDFTNDGVREGNIREALAADDRITEFFRLAEQIEALLNSHPGLGEITLKGENAINCKRLQRAASSLIKALAMEYTPRNAPCFCGSGKKFKKCHGLNRQTT
jgi:SEC-C motif